MTKKHPTAHTAGDIVVVDGSNIATEGRSAPTLVQLNDAVIAFTKEHPDASVTVVVDATFGHRIPSKEVKEFDEAVANNELVTPPAGAVGRGDAFVLAIADKVGAKVLSNDSFQEFHGDYPWLFDDGRLIGGKPVPHVGWVFVERLPVQGPKSRKAIRDARVGETAKKGTKAATSKPRSRRRSSKTDDEAVERAVAEAGGATSAATPSNSAPAATSGGSGSGRGAERQPASQPAPVNDTLPFLEFVEKHPIGTSVNVEVESYSSHGAYATVGDVRAYIPLSLMDDPAPRSARKVMAIGEALTLVVASFSPSRRSIDLAYPHMVPSDGGASARSGGAASSGGDDPDASSTPAPAKQAATKKSAAKKATPAKATPAKAATKQASTTETAGKETAATKKTTAAAKKSAAPKATAEATLVESETATKSVAKKTAAKKSAAKKSTAQSVEKAAAKKTATKKAAETGEKPAAAKKTTAKAGEKAAAKKTTAKTTATKSASKSASNNTAAKKTAAKKTTTRRTAEPAGSAGEAADKPTAASPAPNEDED